MPIIAMVQSKRAFKTLVLTNSCCTRSTGRKITLASFQVTPGDVKYLERLLENMQKQTEEVRKYTKDKNIDDSAEDSSSGSGSGGINLPY